MRVPSTGQPLFERRIVREGKRLAERLLAGYAVTGNGRFIPEARARYWARGRGDGRPRPSTSSG